VFTSVDERYYLIVFCCCSFLNSANDQLLSLVGYFFVFVFSDCLVTTVHEQCFICDGIKCFDKCEVNVIR